MVALCPRRPLVPVPAGAHIQHGWRHSSAKNRATWQLAGRHTQFTHVLLVGNQHINNNNYGESTFVQKDH